VGVPEQGTQPGVAGLGLGLEDASGGIPYRDGQHAIASGDEPPAQNLDLAPQRLFTLREVVVADLYPEWW